MRARRLICWLDLTIIESMGAETEPYSPWKVIEWWEIRRLVYNAILLGVGIPSFLLFVILLEPLPPGEDAVEPMALILAPFAANFAYTFGWILELIVGPETRKHRELVWRIGVGFTICVVLAPTVLTAALKLLGLSSR
jgi:hypothetical protein